MVNGVNGNSKLGVLLQQKQKKLESINQQKQAVENELNQINSAALSSKVKVEDKEMSLSDAIVALQNHPYKGMKEPDSGDVKYEIKDAEGKSNGYNQAQFDKDMAEFKKAEAEYKNLEKNVKEQTKELEITKADLDKMMAEAQKKEDELKATGTEYDVTYGEIEDLNKQIDEESKTAEVDVTLSKDKNNDTLVEATVNQLKALQEQGLVDKNIDLKNLKPEQLKKLSEAVVNQDIKNGTVAEGTSLDGTSADYTKLKAGDGRKYTVAQMQDLAKSLNTETDSGVSYNLIEDFKAAGLGDLPTSFTDPLTSTPSKDEVAGLNTKPEATGSKPDTTTSKPDAKTDKSEIVFPRGVEWQNTSGDKLSDFGITDNGDGTYTSSTGKTYTAGEVNKWFRQIENTVDSNYSKYLDKAEELGIDYTKYSSAKDLKAAVKAKEKENKAIEKAEKKAAKEQAKADKAEQKAEVAQAKADAAQAKADTAKETAETLKAQQKTGTTKMDWSAWDKNGKSFNTDGTYTYGNKTLDANTVDKYKDMQNEMEDADFDISSYDFEDTEKAYKEFKSQQAETKPTTSRTLSSLKDGEKDEEFAAKNRVIADAEEVAMGYSKTADGKLTNTSERKSPLGFKEGQKITIKVNGATVQAEAKVSKNGQKAYLVNGQYYEATSNGQLTPRKLNKADFE